VGVQAAGLQTISPFARESGRNVPVRGQFRHFRIFPWPLSITNVAIRADGSQDLAPVRDVIAMLTACYMRFAGPTETPAGEINGEHRFGRMS